VTSPPPEGESAPTSSGPSTTVSAFPELAHTVSGVIALRELGAMGRVPVEATAFAHRDKGFYLAADNSWEDGDRPEPHLAWTEAFW
jgi:hypothetical protein